LSLNLKPEKGLSQTTIEEAQWYVYLLRCADHTLYTGVTTDCKRRLRQHNGEIKGGAKYTRVRQPVVLVWKERCENRSKACQREAQIKKLSRANKLKLIDKSLV
jgi:putative endonuclease